MKILVDRLNCLKSRLKDMAKLKLSKNIDNEKAKELLIRINEVKYLINKLK